MRAQSAASVELFHSKWLRNGGKLPVAISGDAVSIADTILAILQGIHSVKHSRFQITPTLGASKSDLLPARPEDLYPEQQLAAARETPASEAIRWTTQSLHAETPWLDL